jgi:peptide alpha-N-acetyltransferase
MGLIEKDLSEPYSIFTYRYFISDWPQLCILATLDEKTIGAIVCKLDIRQRPSSAPRKRGYIAMLAVDQQYRKLGIGSRLVREAIYKMILENADEVVLETEITTRLH